MVHRQNSPELFVVDHLLLFHSEEVEHYGNQEEYSVIFWMTQDLFKDHLSDEGEHSIVPAPLMLKLFPTVAAKLVESNLAIQYFAENHSNICIKFYNKDKSYLFYPSKHKSTQSASISIRFPHFTPLFNFISSYFNKNIPVEFWLGNSQSFLS
jgi:hypothetical protein